jgi:hypothetical protein
MKTGNIIVFTLCSAVHLSVLGIIVLHVLGLPSEPALAAIAGSALSALAGMLLQMGLDNGEDQRRREKNGEDKDKHP